MLVPQLAGVVIERVERLAGRVWISASGTDEQGHCPACGTASVRAHSRYRRRVADAPISGAPVVIDLGVRRFFCEQVGCAKRTFVEQIPQLTSRYARRSPGLARMLALERHDFGVVDEAVDHRCGDDIVAEDLATAAEGLVAGDDQRRAFVAG